ncbi:MAG: cell division protein FtsB [Gammaproteobacteria bacterium]|nr:cell division protein FtsB [Gammaproteobacteria bacterium]
MKWIIFLLVSLIIILQVKLWVGDGSLAEVNQLSKAVDVQSQLNIKTKERNLALEAEVKDLKQGLEAVEERARSELGMIKKDTETFYQIVEGKTR